MKALCTYLMHFQLLPYERVVLLMEDLFDAPLSEGTLFVATKQAAAILASVQEAIVTALKTAKTAHFDETGQRIGGVLASPVGYIEIKNGSTRFRPIVDPRAVASVVLACGMAGWLLMRSLHRRSAARS